MEQSYKCLPRRPLVRSASIGADWKIVRPLPVYPVKPQSKSQTGLRFGANTSHVALNASAGRNPRGISWDGANSHRGIWVGRTAQ